MKTSVNIIKEIIKGFQRCMAVGLATGCKQLQKYVLA